jgi:broad specificity phosphatase PhoE
MLYGICYNVKRGEQHMSTEIILIRHGEPRYDEVLSRHYFGMGFDLGKLTEKGVEQAEKRALDPILEGAELIISSPYTRALQTAAIISRATGIKLAVENDLHEWMPDVTFKFEMKGNEPYEEYMRAKGIRQIEHVYHWEEYEVLKNRVRNALEKYKDYQKIIVVCHGIVMSTMTCFEDLIEHCGVRVVTL